MPTMVQNEGIEPVASACAQAGQVGADQVGADQVGAGQVGAGQAGILQCAFAGVAFELVGDGLLDFQPPAAYGEYLAETGSLPVAASVCCELVTDPGLGQCLSSLRSVSWSHLPDGGCRITGGYMVAELALVAPGRYSGVVRVAKDPYGAAACLRFVAAALVEARGGLNLHAAAIDLDGQAIAFTGPSGAGKSTACDLAPAARCLAYDQLAVYPSGDGYFGWALPWGKSSRLARTPACALPMRAVLRVGRGDARPQIRLADAAHALFVLREAATVSESGIDAEQRRLGAALALAEQVAVGHIDTVLGHDIDGLLREHFGLVAGQALGQHNTASGGSAVLRGGRHGGR